MRPSEKCRRAGLDGLAELGEITGVQERTLINWARNRGKLFEVIVAGAAKQKGEDRKMVTMEQIKAGEVFGRVREDGDVDVLYSDDGCAVTRIDASVYPVGSEVSARYEHPEGIVLKMGDAVMIGLELEGGHWINI